MEAMDNVISANQFDAIIQIPGQQKSIMLGIKTEAGHVTKLEFLPELSQQLLPKNATATEAVKQIKAYFSDPIWRFDLPISYKGSEFQSRVWRALTSIKSGDTITYGELARKLNSGARAVGHACRQNPLPIIVPCHRVVAKAGLGGFAGHSKGSLVNFKQWLLRREHAYAN